MPIHRLPPRWLTAVACVVTAVMVSTWSPQRAEAQLSFQPITVDEATIIVAPTAFGREDITRRLAVGGNGIRYEYWQSRVDTAIPYYHLYLRDNPAGLFATDAFTTEALVDQAFPPQTAERIRFDDPFNLQIGLGDAVVQRFRVGQHACAAFEVDFGEFREDGLSTETLRGFYCDPLQLFLSNFDIQTTLDLIGVERYYIPPGA